MPTPAPRTALLAAATGLLLLTSACGADTSGEPEAGAGAEDGSDAFPVTIDHIWGSTTVEEEPERVVVLGVTDADPVLALGVVPQAVSGFSFYLDGLGVGPWAEPYLDGARPDVLASSSDIDVEQIATYDPDLIVAVSAGFEEPVYEQLSQIAPTVVRPAGTDAYAVPRDDATRMIARALGQEARGEELIDEANAAYADAVEAHPDFAGATGTVVLPYDGKYGAYLPGDNRGQAMDQLGFELPDAVVAADPGDSFFVEVSRERLDMVDGDVLVVLTDEGTRATVEQDPVLQNLPVSRAGGLVLPDLDLRGAMTYNSVLSVPYVVDRLVPLLQEALDARS
ncbi:iron-siderophore ABC transporter substrate-binding protein [Blastococcus sp. SYSU D00695]